MKIAALLIFETLMAFLAATSADGTAEKIILYSAAGAGLLWFWVNIARPVTKVLKRTAKAVDAFEHLPRWQLETEARLASMEGAVDRMRNGQKAIIRELGIEDAVRRMPPEFWDA